MNNRDGTPMLSPVRRALAANRVRHVGEAVAVVIAESVAEAKDAAEAVALDIESLPAVTAPSEAAVSGAPILYDEVPGNVGLDFHFGDTNAVEAAFTNAAHVTRLDLRANRIVVNAMEPRSASALYDAERGHKMPPRRTGAGGRRAVVSVAAALFFDRHNPRLSSAAACAQFMQGHHRAAHGQVRLRRYCRILKGCALERTH
jgi:hypothetical protein